MKYRKIKVSFKEYPNRFNRVLYVRENISLQELGCVLVAALGGAFEHYFLFENKRISYVPSVFLEDYVLGNEVDMKDYKMLDLSDTFRFTYDTGDGWEFNIKVYKKEYEINDEDYEDSLGIIISAVGQGIWEDNIYALYSYLEGKIKNLNKQDEEEGIYFPWNHHIDSFSQFDDEVDLEYVQSLIDCCGTYDENYNR